MTTTLDPSLQRRLIDAIERRDLDGVMTALHAGADPSRGIEGPKIDDYVDFPVFAATKLEFIPCLDLLYRAGANINWKTSNCNFTALIVASSRNLVEAGRWLLQHGADINPVDNFDQTALSSALVFKKFNFADMMLEERPECRGDHLLDAAKRVIGRGEISVAHWLLQQGVSPNLIDKDGHSWLRLVHSFNDDATGQLVELLLRADADVNLVDGTGSTPLHETYKHQAISSFIRLLDASANPDIPDKDGHTVRSLIEEKLPLDADFHSAFVAWEASQTARRIIEHTSTHPRVRAL